MHRTVLLAAAVALAACQDSAVAPEQADLYDLSKVQITKGDGSAPSLESRKGTGLKARTVIEPCHPDYGCPQSPKPLADFDYGPYIEQGYSGSNKRVLIMAWSDNHANIQSMTLTGIFKSVGGQGAQGCNATPAEFSRETKSGAGVPYSTYLSLWVERTALYPSTSTFVWQVDGQHYFLANLGYSVDGYNRSGTFYSSARTCF